MAKATHRKGTPKTLVNHHAPILNHVSSLTFPRHSECSEESGGGGGGALIDPRLYTWASATPYSLTVTQQRLFKI
ncbi:MAG: hypothetical protein WCX86_06335 [Candidatus Hydrogenedentales bacterium]